jgi:glycerophosphoryl diester phosphodiesterase
LAWQQGVPAIELDVHLTKDNRLVVIHDADTKRTAGVEKAIQESTLDELRDLDVGQWKNARWQGEKLATLDQVLEALPPKTRCFIEVKVGPEATPALVQAIEKCGKPIEQLCVISFNAEAVAATKRQLPQLQAYFLSDFRVDQKAKTSTPSAEELIARAKSLQADGLDLSHKGPLDADFVRKVKAAGLQLYVWTVDDLEDAKKLAALGVDGITTNKPAWLMNQLSRSDAAR